MIRFCDKEICCVAESQLNRQQLLEYFMNGHRGEIVCVLDDNGKFTGSVTYLSLLGRDIKESVNRDSIVLGETAWQDGRKCFERIPEQYGIEKLVPVTDQEQNLLCFAYQDLEADQELRMLDELMEYKSVLGFKDLYPEYEHVIIHGCNELSYQFAAFLKMQDIPVSVTGSLWEKLDVLENVLRGGDMQSYETIDYKTLNIYGEGTYPKDDRLELRQSVSPEFECVDKIYEANIRQGTICDAEKNMRELLEFLKEKPIAILGTNEFSLNAYDFFIAHGLDICCFVSNNCEKQEIFGKSVVHRIYAIEVWKDIVFIQADKKYSAWGFGEVNIYHGFGYKRNKSFFLLQDYVDLPQNGLKNLLTYWVKHMSGKLVLTGDLWLCTAMEKALQLNTGQICKIVYCDVLQKYKKEKTDIQKISGEEIQKEDFCMLLLPKYWGIFLDRERKINYRRDLKRKYKEAMEPYGVSGLLDYPFEDVDWIRAERIFDVYSKPELKVKRIILGAINSYCGNELFSEILDGHPEVIQMPCMSLSVNLYSICVRLAMQTSDQILPLFWALYEEGRMPYEKDNDIFPDKDVFHCSMKELLAEKRRFTSQEIFVMLHIAYAKMLDIKVTNISDMTIYWEPHSMPRNEVEHYAEWLDDVKDQGYIVNIVRNSYASSGSGLNLMDADRPVDRMLTTVFYPMEERIEKKDYEHWQRIVLKFEKIKCNPKEEMQCFCKKTGILWSDQLLDIKKTYSGLSGFDLAPVYRIWEQYYSSFDRFRICLIKGPWQRKYGYPYARSLDFSRLELQQMFFKKFRFEENWDFADRELENAFLKWREQLMFDILWDVRRKEILGE